MKTKEEVKKHVLSVGYNQIARDKICGFLVAKELKGCDEVLKFKKGVLDFKDFLLWFNMEMPPLSADELEYGDYVHVEDGHDVIVITLMEDTNTFVGCDGVEVGCYILSDKSRMCNDNELAYVLDKMHDNGLDFDYASCSLVPLSECSEEDE